MIIDSCIGGLGDIWMRLQALYTLSRIRRGERHKILIHPDLVPLARVLFSDRFDIDHAGEGDVIYTHLGLRHLMSGLLQGKRYVLPFYWLMRTNRKSRTIKHRLNDIAILATAKTGRIWLTNPKSVTDYEGYMEMSALPPFQDVTFAEFARESSTDLQELEVRLKKNYSTLTPKNKATVVYPSGNAHQIMPVAWAQKHLATATYAFHHSDPYACEFENNGLDVEKFTTLDELFAIGWGANRIISTDSFPSHLWQVYSTNVLLLMAEQASSFIVHPSFPRSQIITSRAPCSPCLHIARGSENKPCEIGHPTCITWWNPEYEASFKASLSS